MSEKPHILIIDDEEDIRILLAGVLEDEGFHTSSAATDIQALEAVKQNKPDIILLDIWLEGSQHDGLYLLSKFMKHTPEIPIIMISGHGNIETAVEAMQKGAIDFIQKPIKVDHLLVVIHKAFEHKKLKQEVAHLKAQAKQNDQLIGNSLAIQKIKQMIAKVGPTSSRVFIFGPSGCGKEIIARAIHQNSEYKSGPFIPLNCAHLAPDDFEKALFGSEGALPKQGILEKAHQGTLFLDEVVDMPPLTQSKFIRIIQEKTFTKREGAAPIHVDFRVISASSKDIRAYIQQGLFRDDLYYRLNVVPIEVPALKERREDIPTLCEYFLSQFYTQDDYLPKTLNKEVEALLLAYDWPGNVRELRNVLERMLIMSSPNKHAFHISDLPNEVTKINNLPEEDGNNLAPFLSYSLKEAREHFEKKYLEQQVKRFSGNITKTAEFIGMERAALHRKLKMLKVDNE